jgi:hypothetical protein
MDSSVNKSELSTPAHLNEVKMIGLIRLEKNRIPHYFQSLPQAKFKTSAVNYENN